MNALFAARRFDKCACLGVYTGTPMLGSEFNATKKRIAKEYARDAEYRQVPNSIKSRLAVTPGGVGEGIRG